MRNSSARLNCYKHFHIGKEYTYSRHISFFEIFYAGEAASLEYSIFRTIGVRIEDTMIRKITDVK